MTKQPAGSGPLSSWSVLRGPGTPGELQAILAETAAAVGLDLRHAGPQNTVLAARDGAAGRVSIRWQPHTPASQRTLGQVRRPGPHLEILIDPGPGPDSAAVAGQARDRLSLWLHAYSQAELDQVTATMPLVTRYATADLGLAGWALIFRDHYVENTIGFLLGAQRAGIPAQWIYALAKGDRTASRDRVHATLLAQGFASGVLDNTAINAPAAHAGELARAMAAADAFIDAAHAAGRRVLVIDDGGLLAQGYGRADAARRVDAAIELTVSGLKRIAAAGPLGIPVLNLARSQLKTHLGYPEIADSCLRRLRALLPAYKVTGRPVLVIGFGALGSRLAAALSAQGCQIHVADTDPLALICAAQTGYRTYRTAGEALHSITPFLILGTTGEDALSAADLALLPEGVFLAPFATKDFSLLPEHSPSTASIPGTGRVYHLGPGRDVVLLGDGRSLNLFEADAIPNQGYDAYRAGTLIAAGTLCRQAGQIPPGVHASRADDIIRESGLYDAYYDTYLAAPAARPATVRDQPAAPARTGHRALQGLRACVVGYGVAGRLHAQILTASGAELTILDPAHQELPRHYRSLSHGVADLPDAIAAGISLWSVCCPTPDHLPVLRSILGRDPQARVLLEKPACQGHEIDALAGLLSAYRNARVVITDQYRHARALTALTGLIARLAPGQPIERVGITFSKDRTADILRGRFIDRCYGVLGYEWLHMLTVLGHLLTPQALTAYLAGDPQRAELWATYHPQLFVSALTERTSITVDDAPVHIELASSITSPTVILSSVPPAGPDPSSKWRRDRRPPIDQHRHIAVHAGDTQFTAHLDPVTAPGGWQLDRNQHRITASRDRQLLHDETIGDSPLHTAFQHSASVLLAAQPPPPPDLAPLRRIAALAEFLRAQQPLQQQPAQART